MIEALARWIEDGEMKFGDTIPDHVIEAATAGHVKHLLATDRAGLAAMTDDQLRRQVVMLRDEHRKQPQIADALVDGLRQARALARRMDAEGL